MSYIISHTEYRRALWDDSYCHTLDEMTNEQVVTMHNKAVGELQAVHERELCTVRQIAEAYERDLHEARKAVEAKQRKLDMLKQ